MDCILKLTKKVNHVKAISPGHSRGGGALSIPYVRNAGITQRDWVYFLGNPPEAGPPLFRPLVVFGWCIWSFVKMEGC